MGLITAGLATAMTGSGAMTVPGIICVEPKPVVEKLLSERMPLQVISIRLTVQPAIMTRQMTDAVHSAILRSFEHQYHL